MRFFAEADTGDMTEHAKISGELQAFGARGPVVMIRVVCESVATSQSANPCLGPAKKLSAHKLFWSTPANYRISNRDGYSNAEQSRLLLLFPCNLSHAEERWISHLLELLLQILLFLFLLAGSS
jgi:hypothetical protein